jgi:hypothetical protein
MAIRLFSEFKSDNGTQYKIEIHDANWLAAATEFNVDSRGFDLTYEGETDDIVSPIVGSKLTFGAYSANGTFETFIDTLKTFQENRFQLAVRKYNGTSYDLYWAGWITQDLVNVEDASQPYIYEITATDGIGRLANIDYDDNNSVNETNGFKVSRITDVLKTSFDKIGTAGLWGSSDVFFETSADWWETNAQTYSTANDPLATQGFDVRYFREKDDDGNDVYSSTLEILRQVATLYNARIFMQNGRFVFEQYGNRDAASRYVSRYTKTATHIGRVLVSDDVTIDQSINGARRAGNNWNFLPAAQLAKIHYVQRFLNPFNAFGQYRFRTTNTSYTAGFIAGGSGIQLNLGSTSFNFKVVGAPTATSPIFPVFKIRIRIQDSSTGTYYYCNRTYNGYAAGGAMFGIPSWSTTSGEYFFDLPSFFSSGTAVVNYPVAIITPDIPVNGELDFVLSLHGVFRAGNGATYTPTQTPLFDSIFVFGIETNGATNAPGATFSSTNNDTSVDSNLTIDLGDVVIADGPRQSGHLAAYNGTNWLGTSDWRKGSTGTALPILKLLSNETLALHVRPIEQYNGNVIGTFYLGQRIVFDSEAYLMTGGTFAANTDEWSGTWYRIQTIRASVSELPELPDLVARNTIASATTSGVSPNDIVGGRISGMDIDIENEKIGPFQQTSTGARVNGTMNVTGDVTLDAGLDVDGVSQFNNDVNITGSVTSTGPLTGEYVQLDTTYNTTPVQGQIVWSQDDGTIDVGLNSNVVMQVGQEEFWFVKNQTGSTIPKGSAVRAAGTLGASGRILAAPMVADGSVPPRFFLGIAAEDILDGGEGYVTTFGKIRQLNTSSFTEGAVLWCNPAVAGGLTSTEPAAPNLKLAVAFVVRSNATSGVLAVRSETGSRVSDASDVQITSVADNDLLQYNTATSRWENVAGTTTNIGEGTNLYFTNARSRAAISETIDGISYNNTTGVFSLDAGRVIVTTTQTGEWDTAYNDRIVSAAVTGTTSKTLTLTQGDGGTITATWSDYDTAPVTSVNGLTGAVVLTTSNIGEVTNLYFTDARARAALSAGVGISYNNGTGVITNAAPDQVVAVTASTGIAVTGAYPNFTIENTAPDQVVALTASTGISVTGTYPNFTITNTAPSSGGTITGGGTTNYLSKWTSGSALGNSLVFDNGTNVGIGTATPAKKLHIKGGDDDVLFLDNGGQRYTTQYFANNGTTKALLAWDNTNSLYSIGSAVASDFNFLTANAERMRITNAGNVGIGTTAPATRLHVDGSGHALVVSNDTGNRRVYIGTDSTGEPSIQATLSNGTARQLNINPDGGNVGIGTTSPDKKLVVTGDGTGTAKIGIAGFTGGNYTGISFNGTLSEGNYNILSSPTDPTLYINRPTGSSIQFRQNNVTQMIIGVDGNVGIGTTSPSYKLHVNGAFGTNPGAYVSGDTYGILGVSKGISNASAGVNYYQGSTQKWFTGVYENSDNYGFYSVGTAGFPMVIQYSTGNVGIGTTAPGARLEVVAGNTTSISVRSGNSGQYSILSVGRTSSDIIIASAASSGQFWTGSVAGDGWVGSTNGTLSLGNDTTGVANLTIKSGNVGIGTTAPQVKTHIYNPTDISLAYDENQYGLWISQTSTSKSLILGYSNTLNAGIINAVHSGVAWRDILIATNGGNVGIGTTSPGQKLDVAGIIRATSTNPFVIRAKTSSGSDSRISFEDPVNASNDSVWVGSTGHNLTFGAFYDERMRITSAGNVGIGTTAPTNIIHVVGVPRFDSPSDPPTLYNAGVDVDRYYGTNEGTLTSPEMWLKIDIDGVGYLIPAFEI